MDQIERVAGATQTLVLLDQQVMHIWPNGGSPDFPEITLARNRHERLSELHDHRHRSEL